MKKIFVSACLIFSLIGLAQAQEKIQPNDLVKAALSEKEINGILSADPNGIAYYNFLTEKAWFLLDIPEEKKNVLNEYPFLYRFDRKAKIRLADVFEEKDISSFNILLYDYAISKGRNYYRIKGSNLVLVIKSQKEITNGVNNL